MEFHTVISDAFKPRIMYKVYMQVSTSFPYYSDCNASEILMQSNVGWALKQPTPELLHVRVIRYCSVLVWIATSAVLDHFFFILSSAACLQLPNLAPASSKVPGCDAIFWAVTLTLSLLSSKRVFSQPFKKQLYE